MPKSSKKSKSERVYVQPETAQSVSPYAQYGSNSSPNSIVLIVIGLVLFVAGFFLGKLWQENQSLKQGAQQPVAQAPAGDTGPTQETLNKAPAPQKEDNTVGAKNPKVVMVEYSDFECPFCNRFHPTTKQIIDEYPNDVALVYRHYPLSFHAFAQKSAETSECVAKAGGNDAFWKYADYIFAQQADGTVMSQDLIDESVAQSGANADAVKGCVDSGEMTAKVNAQLAEGQAAGVQGTPGTIVFTKDGAQELIGGALPYEQVKAVVEKYL
ncbi:MAG TPA: thioredoxin domain-containing protein [Candidatus Woesebacteria bacterium]|nr:thioredoxin domain-containing protein [Candidatus Woesebacteria bacterium]